MSHTDMATPHLRQVPAVFHPGFYSTLAPNIVNRNQGGDGPHGKESEAQG